MDGGCAAALQLELDLTDRHRTLAGFDLAMIECDLDRAGRQVQHALMPVDVGGEYAFNARAFDIGAKLLRDKGHRQRDVWRERGYARFPLAAAQRIVAELGLHGLHEARAILPDAERQAVAPQRPLRRVVIDGFEVFSRTLVARIRGYDRRVVEIGEAVGIDQKLELDLDVARLGMAW